MGQFKKELEETGEFFNVPLNAVPLPESFVEWLDNEYRIEEEEYGTDNDDNFDPWFTSYGSVYDLMAKNINEIPDELWPEFSLYLAKLADYLLQEDGQIDFKYPFGNCE